MIQIDITGQVASDSLGSQFISGFGGQVDFLRGAAASEGGKPIIAMPSVTKTGASKIVPVLTQGSGVVTGRSDLHYFVTENGIVHLFGKTAVERARLIISVAAPQHKEVLITAARERFPGFTL